MLKCGKCRKHLPVESFTINQNKNKPFSMCEPCRDKNREYMKEFRNSDHGKALIKEYFASPGGKAARKRVNDSPGTRALHKKYWDKNGRRVQATFRKTEKGKAHQKRCSESRLKKISESPALQLRFKIAQQAKDAIRGRNSALFSERTAFSSSAEYRAALEITFRDDMSFDNYGSVWQCDHRIPQSAYDFSDPDDVRRCWSKTNVQALTPEQNLVKSWKIIDSECLSAGVECFPNSWNGAIPDDAQKGVLHARFRMGVQA